MPPRSCPWTGTGCACPGCAAGRRHPRLVGRHPPRKHLYGPVLDRIRPRAAGRLRLPRARRPRRGSWWDWAPAKHVLEDLFDQGTLLVHDRVNFERRYDLAERILPAGVDTTEPTAAEAALELTLLGAGALGVGTAADLADYHRLRPARAKAALAEAVAAGLLQEVAVAGWTRPAYLLPGTRVPRRVAHPPVLLSPFDSLIWSRERTERLFGFRYRLEVYVPAARRVHGYYTMPVLATGRRRVDPKHDRQAGRLLLRNLLLEPAVDPPRRWPPPPRPTGRPPGRRRVETGDAMPAALAKELRVALGRTVPRPAGAR